MAAHVPGLWSTIQARLERQGAAPINFAYIRTKYIEENTLSFWSSQTLERRISELLDDSEKASIDCNALQLRIGREIYVTPNLAEANTHTKKHLADDEAFVIPPGQFAFLLTEEVVSVPPDAMALISMKATFKMKGLVNVSGFHVDPGWQGRLIFAVFNAGPQPVHLQRGLQLFLIWYATLDEASAKRKNDHGLLSIPPATINNLTGGSDSFFELKKKLESEVKRLEDECHAFEKRFHRLDLKFTGLGIACTTLTAIILTWAFKTTSTLPPPTVLTIERPSAAAVVAPASHPSPTASSPASVRP